jgi:methionyl-tRNA formyltransferase
MKILFVGSVEFSEVILRQLILLDANIVGVVSAIKSPMISDYADLTKIADEEKITSYITGDINSRESIDWISKLNPDVIFCIGWSRILSQELLSMPRLGVIGYHPTELPKNRGRHPIIWTLVLGLHQTASTFFFMNQDVDSGDIISQVTVDLDEHENARSLYKKLNRVASNQVKSFFSILCSGKLIGKKQEIVLSNSWRKRSKSDEIIDWRMSAITILRLTRALSEPYPGASFLCKGAEHKLWDVELVSDISLDYEPGKLLYYENNLYPIIKCGEQAVRLVKYDPVLSINVGEYL